MSLTFEKKRREGRGRRKHRVVRLNETKEDFIATLYQMFPGIEKIVVDSVAHELKDQDKIIDMLCSMQPNDEKEEYSSEDEPMKEVKKELPEEKKEPPKPPERMVIRPSGEHWETLKPDEEEDIEYDAGHIEENVCVMMANKFMDEHLEYPEDEIIIGLIECNGDLIELEKRLKERLAKKEAEAVLPPEVSKKEAPEIIQKENRPVDIPVAKGDIISKPPQMEVKKEMQEDPEEFKIGQCSFINIKKEKQEEIIKKAREERRQSQIIRDQRVNYFSMIKSSQIFTEKDFLKEAQEKEEEKHKKLSPLNEKIQVLFESIIHSPPIEKPSPPALPINQDAVKRLLREYPNYSRLDVEAILLCNENNYEESVKYIQALSPFVEVVIPKEEKKIEKRPRPHNDHQRMEKKLLFEDIKKNRELRDNLDYDEMRKDEFAFKNACRLYLQNARKAKRARKEEEAERYEDMGKEMHEKYIQAKTDAKEKIFNYMNQLNDPLERIDLHGLHVDEAIETLNASIPTIMEMKHQGKLRIAANGTYKYRIITGVGKHSKSGRSVLQEAVRKTLKEKRFRFTEDERNGVFDVQILPEY